MTTTEQIIDTIPNGIYLGVSEPVYRSSKPWAGRMTPSVLEQIVEGAWSHVKAAFDGELYFDTDSLAFGRAYHCKMLEPDRYKVAFAVAGRCEGQTEKKLRCSLDGAYRCGGAWFCRHHIGALAVADKIEVISPNEEKTILAMQAKVLAHPVVKLLRQHGGCEVCIAWTSPSGVRCKTRLDKYIPECSLSDGASIPYIIDLKTVRSANPRELSKAMESYGWARAAEMRCDGIEALTGKRPGYCLVCQEKEPPYEVVPVMIGTETREGAAKEVRDYLAAWAQHCKNGTFPGYADDFVELDAPGWKLKEYAKEGVQ